MRLPQSVITTRSAKRKRENHPHFVKRAVHEYSCSQAIGLRSRVRLLSQRKASRQNSELENSSTQRGCSGAAASSCQVLRNPRALTPRTDIKRKRVNNRPAET